MVIQSIIEELVGKESTEYEQFTIFLDISAAARVSLLSRQLGVSTSRLCAELISSSIGQAEHEWG
ncbi:hypothetical protein, partial [Candidatus Izimaplasma sp. ZiA1]|uniref:hypothetical protein n=1 Tax=Candidatus Izimoplasma sp. ZiA1 TaxID=2024899 RepID=UPI00196B421B